MKTPSSARIQPIVLAGIGLLQAVAVHGATLYVWGESPNPVPPYASWDSAARAIQTAVDAAKTGDTVRVGDGIYASGMKATSGSESNRVVINKAITVESENGPAVTCIIGAPDPGGDWLGNGRAAVRCVYLGSNARLSGFTLSNGHSGVSTTYGRGGGAYGGSSAVVSNCVITGNSSANRGGGIYGLRCYNSLITANSSKQGGGAATATLYNCVLWENQASSEGGGAYSCTLYHGTVVGNQAGSRGGGVVSGRAYSSIIYYNLAPTGPNYVSGSFSYCCATPLPPGSGNIGSDPELASAIHLAAGSPCIEGGLRAHSIGTDIDGDFWADPPSMGADERSEDSLFGPLSLTVDLSHLRVATGFVVTCTARIEGHAGGSSWDFGDGTVLDNRPLASHSWSSPGTYEVRLRAWNNDFPEGVTNSVLIQVEDGHYYVSRHNPTPLYPFTNWQTAATSIQDAIDASVPNGNVWVADGVYDEGEFWVKGDLHSRVALIESVAVRSTNGPTTTVIQGSPDAFGWCGAMAVRCAYVGSNCVLSGFTLTQGYTLDAGLSDINLGGGGAWCEASGMLSNCVITGNTAYKNGGGVHGGRLYHCVLTNNWASAGGGAARSTLHQCLLAANAAELAGGGAESSELFDCTLAGNKAVYGVGGGASASSLSNCVMASNQAHQGGGAHQSTMEQCLLKENSAGVDESDAHGGGVSDCVLFRCELTDNQASAFGGAAHLGVLQNCVLTGNWAGDSGGGAAGSQLYNCTLLGNQAAIAAGGVLDGILTNCIVWFNGAFEYAEHKASTFGYCCTTPLPEGAGNTDQEPGLAGCGQWCFELAPGSACIDAGVSLPDLAAADFHGNARALDGNGDGFAFYDMGAVEFAGAPSPPVILAHPLDATLEVGMEAVFSVLAAGTEPFSYQWFYNGEPIPDETSRTLWRSVYSDSPGYYSVRISNAWGQVHSANARLAAVAAFSAPLPLHVPAAGPASHYPSTNWVDGLTAVVTKVTVTLDSLSHTYPDDLDILVVAPSGQSVMLMSDAGGSSPLVPVTLRFDDDAPNRLPDEVAINSGTYRPADYQAGDTLPAPAPLPPYGLSLSNFNGLDPNGPWQIFVYDHAPGDSGTISGGWSLAITVGPRPQGPILSLAAAGNSEMMIRLPTLPACSYEVQYKDSLDTTLWQVLQTISGDGTVKKVTVPATEGSQRFYRVQVR